MEHSKPNIFVFSYKIFAKWKWTFMLYTDEFNCKMHKNKGCALKALKAHVVKKMSITDALSLGTFKFSALWKYTMWINTSKNKGEISKKRQKKKLVHICLCVFYVTKGSWSFVDLHKYSTQTSQLFPTSLAHETAPLSLRQHKLLAGALGLLVASHI